MKQKVSAIPIIRNIIQLLCFLFLPGLFIDAFNGIKALVLAISSGNVDAATLLPALFPSVLLIVATMVFGRFFCGFMCAFGTLGDTVHFIGRKLFKNDHRVPELADKKLKLIKYSLLVFLIFTWISGIGVLSGWSPWDAFGSLLSWPPNISYAFTSMTIGSILLALIVIGSLFVERFFCRYFCPMGAIFSIVSMLRISKIRKTRTNCGKCKVCTSKCKMGISLYQRDVVSSGECIECMQCISPCPRNNVKFTVNSTDVAPLMASVAAASVIGLYYVGNIGLTAFETSQSQTVASDTLIEDITSTTLNNNATYDSTIAAPFATEGRQTESQTASSSTDSSNQSSEIATSETAEQTQEISSGFADGTYEGSGTGFHNGTTTVSVTISNGVITDIATVSTRDDAPYYNRAFTTVTSEIISSQSASVSAVSGATFSSRGIMSAVADALSQAQ